MFFGFEFGRAKIVVISIGALSLYLIKDVLINLYMRRVLDAKRNAKIANLEEAKAKFSLYLKNHRIPEADIEDITKLSLLQLIQKLKSQEIPPAYVLLAYQHKAFEVDKKFNCAVEFLYPELSDVNLKGPLAGVPVSLKECIGMKGLDSCCGCSCYIDAPHEDDALALKLIRDLGGIPFVRTTVPQTMMSTQCSNPINGVTLNPLRPDRTCHGSSGGEGALIGGGGSPIGFGTDIGGSIRLPAAMCGLVGFKPTTGRLSYRDMSKLATGKLISPTWGPICRDVASCQFMMELLFNSAFARNFDPQVPPLSFQQIPNGRRLRIGYFLKLDGLVPVPAVRRALLSVRDTLISRGHELIEWAPPFTGREYLDIFLRSIFADGCESLRRCLAYDKLDPCIRSLYLLSNMPWYQRWWLRCKLGLARNWESLAVLNALRGFPTIADLESHILSLKAFSYRFVDSIREASLDVLLCPVTGFAVALPINPPYPTTSMLAFQNLANTLNAPAGCMPSGCVVEARDIQVLEQAVNGEEISTAMDVDEENFYRGYGSLSPIHRSMLPLQQGTEGLPIPIQFMSLPWRDELCLYAMRETELGISKTPPPPVDAFAPLKLLL